MALAMPYGNPTPASQGTTPTQGSPWDPYNQHTQDQYQQYLGRAASEDELRMQHGGQANGYNDPNLRATADYNIQNSKEAQEYKNRPQPAPAQDQGGVQNSGGGNYSGGGGGGGSTYPSAPNVPAAYSGPSLQSMIAGARASAPQIQSQYQAQTIDKFQGKDLNIPDYQKTNFSQFNDPRNQQIQGGADANMMHLLNNPESMSQIWQDQMFEKQKDDANSWAAQMGLANNQALVGRGHSLGGGVQQGMNQDLQSQLMQQLLSGRRDIATQAATQNFQDRLNVNAAADQNMSGNVNRASSVYQNLLAGQGAQAGENQFAANYGKDSTSRLADNTRQNYASYLGGAGLQGTENARGEQFRQGAFGLNLNSIDSAEDNALQQYLGDNSTQMGWAGLNNNNALGWANYGLDADGQFLNYLNG